MKYLKIFKKKLSKSPCIHGREKYFNSAVLIPFVKIEGKYFLLFQKRAAEIRQGSEICFPGGKYDPEIDKNFKETSIRETMEELGIEKNKIKVIGQLDTIVTRMGLIVEVYLGILKIIDLIEINPQKTETEKVFLLPLEYFIENKPEEYSVRLEIQPSYIDNEGKEVVLFPSRELDLPDRYQKPWSGKNERIFVYKTEEGIIWGITAEIIYGLIRLLK